MSQNKKFSRRNFIGTAGTALAAFSIVPSKVLAGRGYPQPSDMPNIACIGISNQGCSDIRQIATPDVPLKPLSNEYMAALPKPAQEYVSMVAHWEKMSANQSGAGKPFKLANIYALCDVDQNYASPVFAAYPKAKKYEDWRVMLEKEKSIDGVVIATPDHNHAPIAAAYIRQKKHVYLQKPLARTIYECRKLAELAKEYNIVSQMGNQGHALEGTRQTVEWIQSGVIGQVREVNCYTESAMWAQGNLKRPIGVKVPKNLNWDLWLGPAQEKPFNPEICHFVWRGLWDYGTGLMGDMGAHTLDAIVWALNLGYPKSVQATSTAYSDDYYPLAETVEYEFPERFTQGVGYMPAVKVTWVDGGLKSYRPATLEEGRALQAVTYIGEKGIIMHNTHGAMPELVPVDPGFKAPAPWIERTENNYKDWIDAIKAGKKSHNDFSISAKLAEIMLLTNIATRTQNINKTLEYDGKNMKITNIPEANTLMHYEYRKGWTL
jgi:predicted dehydrogenase